MARVPVSNRQPTMSYFNFTGASPRVEVLSDAGLLVTSDLDLQILFWRSDPSQIGTLMSRLNFTGSLYGFIWSIDNSGAGSSLRMVYRWAPTGSGGGGIVTKTLAAANIPLVSNIPIWFRVTHDVDNGASGNDVRFYWAQYNGTSRPPSTWTQMGTTQNTAGTTTIFNPTDQGIAVGAYNSGTTAPMSAGARIYRGIVRNGIDGPILVDIDASAVPVSGVFFAETSSNNRIGVITGGVSIVNTRPVASGRVAAV